MNQQNIIWILREPRSGSTWFSKKLAIFLNRRHQWFESKNNKEFENFFVARKQLDSDNEFIFDTHNFSAIKGLKNYNDPIVFRVTRKDKVEQFLSHIIAIKYNNNKFFNVYTEQDRNKIPKLDRTVASLHEIREFVRMSKQNDKLWTDYSYNYKNETVYYEDLLQGFSSNILPIVNWSMKIEEEGMPLKLPYNKKDIFINYDQIGNIIKQELEY